MKHFYILRIPKKLKENSNRIILPKIGRAQIKGYINSLNQGNEGGGGNDGL